MRRVSGWFAVWAPVAVALPLMLSNEASAELREFSGTVAEVSSDKLVIDNRRGDRVSFRRSKATKITGARTSWQAIEPGDRVNVSWKMVDEPRIAYKVVVMPPKQKSQK